MFIRMYVCVSVRVRACVAVVCYFVCARSARAWCSWVHQLARTKRGTLVELSNHGKAMDATINSKNHKGGEHCCRNTIVPNDGGQQAWQKDQHHLRLEPTNTAPGTGQQQSYSSPPACFKLGHHLAFDLVLQGRPRGCSFMTPGGRLADICKHWSVGLVTAPADLAHYRQ